MWSLQPAFGGSNGGVVVVPACLSVGFGGRCLHASPYNLPNPHTRPHWNRCHLTSVLKFQSQDRIPKAWIYVASHQMLKAWTCCRWLECKLSCYVRWNFECFHRMSEYKLPWVQIERWISIEFLNRQLPHLLMFFLFNHQLVTQSDIEWCWIN